MKYKAVIFDLFGTLVPNLPSATVQHVLGEIAFTLGADRDEFVRGWNDTFNEQMTGKLRYDSDIIQHICQKIDVPVNHDKLLFSAEFWKQAWDGVLKQTRTEAHHVITGLKSQGYKIGLLSNSSFSPTKSWQDLVLAPLFSATVFSCLVGLMKPDRRIFQLAAEQLGVKTEECVYVADGMDGELKTSSELGMLPLQIRYPGENDYDQYRENWQGYVISSLSELLDIL